MKFGIIKLLRKLQISWNVNEFNFRKKLLGFENANTFLRRLDKNSLIPILKRNGAVIGHDCDIEAPIIFHNCKDFSNLIIGNNCHIGKNCFFDLRDKIIIEDNVVISMQNLFITHLDLNKSKMCILFPASHEPIHIGENSYIGANSTVLSGIVIAQSCFVAAGSIITEDIAEFTMVGGVPAKMIKRIIT